MAKARITRRANPDRPVEKPVVDPFPSSPPVVPAVEPEDVRVSFIVKTDETGTDRIVWDRFKNERGRARLRKIVESEASSMGMARIAQTVDDDELITTNDVFNLLNTVNAQGALMAGFSEEQASILLFSPQEVSAINAKGRADKLLAKYLGPTKFAYKDELIVGLLLSGMLFAKVQAFRRATAPPSPKSANVRPMLLETCAIHSAQYPRGTQCPECAKEAS